MSCCGNRRSVQRARHASPVPAPVPRPTRSAAPAPPIVFEYRGTGTLVVTGPLTGVAYRFAGTGARLAVHAADAPSLVAVPGLKPAR